MIDAQEATATLFCKVPGCTREAKTGRGRYAHLCELHRDVTGQRLSLDEEIERMVSLGETDPLEAARKVLKRHGDDWVREQLSAYAEDILTEMIRRRLGAVRRKAEIALRPGDTLAEGDFKLAKTWVPGYGWKAAGDLTTDDLRAKGAWYETAAVAALTRSRWCIEVADLMDAEGASRLAELHADLPALPQRELLELVA